ncbi:unnamed protein product [Phytomonas sp. Hart1]|nr:unnamed protein product [Phytomonas sp. Hart1]|eukprot:CCW66206.1 unnamed protein product [Phytomonas sp. isolate Hart1]
MCGPSGVGKGTLLGRLRRAHGDRIQVAVSHTTRAPRPGERDGHDYHFVDPEVMATMRANGELLEAADIHGNVYGTSAAALHLVSSSGHVCLLEVDVQGASSLRAKEGEGALTARFFFITAPITVLEDRLRKRGTESEATLKRRLRTAKAEFDFLESNPDFFNAVIVNDDLDRAYARLVACINATFTEFGMPLLGEGKENGEAS